MPPEQITMHGNNKMLDELTRAVTVGVGYIVADPSRRSPGWPT